MAEWAVAQHTWTAGCDGFHEPGPCPARMIQHDARLFLSVPGESRLFRGYRPRPPAEYAEKGITNSGSSPDYEGVVWADGTVSIRWLTEYRSFSNWDSWEDFYQVHGHPEYGTKVIFQGDEGWR